MCVQSENILQCGEYIAGIMHQEPQVCISRTQGDAGGSRLAAVVRSTCGKDYYYSPYII